MHLPVFPVAEADDLSQFSAPDKVTSLTVLILIL